MADVFIHKGFVGSVHFSADDSLFHGRIEGIDDLVTFEGASVNELRAGFKEAVGDYLELCKRTGKPVEKSYRGTFNVRVPPALHRKAARQSSLRGISLNQLVRKALEAELNAGAVRDEQSPSIVALRRLPAQERLWTLEDQISGLELATYNAQLVCERMAAVLQEFPNLDAGERRLWAQCWIDRVETKDKEVVAILTPPLPALGYLPPLQPQRVGDPKVPNDNAACEGFFGRLTDPAQVLKILRYLVKTGKPPPGLDPASLD